MSCKEEHPTETEENCAKRMKMDQENTESNEIKTDIGQIANVDNTDESNPPNLSKKQLKKLLKKEQWLKRKPEKRAREKAKQKQKKIEAKLNSIELGPSRSALKKATMAKSNCNIHVVIDLSFDDYMNSKELAKCIKQILRCYSLNRRANNPMKLHLTDFKGRNKEEMSKHAGYQNWDLYFHEENYTRIFKPEDIVYLTSESDNVISSLEDDKAYIIGGLVDHNARKGLCHQLAQEKNLQHGQLPIGKYLEMKTRKVLTIDHVFEILLGVSEGKSWKDAFLTVLPARKGAAERLLDLDHEEISDSEVNTEQDEGDHGEKNTEEKEVICSERNIGQEDISSETISENQKEVTGSESNIELHISTSKSKTEEEINSNETNTTKEEISSSKES